MGLIKKLLRAVAPIVTVGIINPNKEKKRAEEATAEATRITQATAQLEAQVQPLQQQIAIQTEVVGLCGEDVEMKGACSSAVLPCSIQPSQPGNTQIAVLGITSSGKSTLINTVLGPNAREVAETGPGETTLIHKQYASMGFDLWDTMGLSDENTLLAQVPLAKAVDLVMVVVEVPGSLKNVSRLLRVLKAIKKRTIVVVNKIDQMSPEELEGLKVTIRKEMEGLCAPETPCFFVSTKSPETTTPLNHYITA